MQGVQGNGRAYIRDTCGLHPCGDAQPCIGIRIGRLENEAREISRTMNDVLARAACDLKDMERLSELRLCAGRRQAEPEFGVWSWRSSLIGAHAQVGEIRH